jgi:hypothetical protein
MRLKLLRIIPLLLFWGCNSPGEEPVVMTSQGALNAEIRHADGTRKRLNSTKDLQMSTLGRDAVYELRTEFAFWREAQLYTENNQLAKAILTARPEDNGRFEEFYFDRKGNLVLAIEGNLDETRSYYFVIDRLVLCLANETDTLKNTAADVKLTSINLVKEAARLKALRP